MSKEKDFASMLKDARLSWQLSITDLAKKADVEKSYLSGIERGMVNPPSPRVTRRLVKVLGLDRREMLVHAWIAKADKEIRDIVRMGALAALESLRDEEETEQRKKAAASVA